MEVHHKMPFHLDKSKELDMANLITLCEANKNGVNCHLLFGHLGSFKAFNAEVDVDSKGWSAKLIARLSL